MMNLVAHSSQALGQSGTIPKEFVYLRDVDPTIIQDIRYAGADNFTGKPVPGYLAAECLLLRLVAEALKRVQMELAGQNLSLKVYDCYRPQRAVRAFMQWADDGSVSELTKRFYPRLNKSELFAQGYIASASGHSRGNAVDLTLVQLPKRQPPVFDAHKKYGACSGPAEGRAPDNSTDMGTGFDCFDVRSHTANPEISAEQQRWRSMFVTVMERHGFKNYTREWWHFTYQMPANAPLKSYDFPVSPRARGDSARGPRNVLR